MKLIRPTLTLLAAAILLAIPSRSEAALTFNLSEHMPDGFFGYSTRQINSNVWDSTGTLTTTVGFNGTNTLTSDANGNLEFNVTGFSAPGQTVVMYADLNLTNITGPNPYGLDAINELHYFYNFSRTAGFDGPLGLGTIQFQFSYPSEPGVYRPVGSDFTTGNNEVLSFQGENLIGGPLIANGDTGTLRIIFSATSLDGSSDITMNLFGQSITAVVPEPSSALLLTGALGLFGGFFRRRRSLAPVED